MSNIAGLTTHQERALREALVSESIAPEMVDTVLDHLRAKLGPAPRPGQVSVSQEVGVVEAGSTMIGLQVDSIG